MLASMMAADGHHLGVARNLHGAFNLIREPWDIVISDLGLPDGSGLDVAQQLDGQANHGSSLSAGMAAMAI